MREKFIIAIVMMIIGAVFGHFTKWYLDAAIPGLEILEMSLSDDGTSAGQEIEIPKEIRELSRESAWFPSLPSETTIGKLQDQVVVLSENVDRMKSLQDFIPTFRESYLSASLRTQTERAREIQGTIMDDETSFSMLISSLDGEIRRRAIEVADSDLDPSITSGRTLHELGRDERTILLLRFFNAETPPNDNLAKLILDHMSEANDRDLAVDDRLLPKVSDLLDRSVKTKTAERLAFMLLFRNDGRSTVALDPYAAVLLDTLPDRPIFLVLEEGADPIILAPGQAVARRFLQRDTLDSKLKSIVESFEDSSHFKVRATGRVVSGATRNIEWLSSYPAELRVGIETKQDQYFRKALGDSR